MRLRDLFIFVSRSFKTTFQTCVGSIPTGVALKTVSVSGGTGAAGRGQSIKWITPMEQNRVSKDSYKNINTIQH